MYSSGHAPMKCRWEDCEVSSPSDFKEHVEEHIKHLAEYRCLWEGCARNREELSNKYALQAHVRIHTGDKPFKCTKCFKNFSRADALNKHVKRHEADERQVVVAVSRVFYGCESRDRLENATRDLLEERQFQTDCLRILQDELLDSVRLAAEDTWEEYL